MIALDFETALITAGLQSPPPVCFSMAEESSASVHLPDLSRIREVLGECVVGARTSYDMGVICSAWPELIPLVFKAYDEDRITDVQIRQKLIDIAMGSYRQHGKYDLASLTKRLCDRELAKEDTYRLRYWELKDLPLAQWPKEAVDYSRMDAEATLDVYNEQEKSLKEVDRLCVLTDQWNQARADFALTLASAWGLRTDREGIQALRSMCEARRAELEGALLDEGLLRQTKTGISKCVRVAQERMFGINPRARLTAKGEELQCREAKYISVDEEACEDSGDPVLEKYSEYGKLGNLLSGHVKAMEEGVETPIHPRFEILLDTGRTSSSSPNVQNVRRAKGARECFIPRPGWVYVDCDYSGAELHTLAQCCINIFGRSCLGDALNAGIDPHAAFGAKLAGTTYEDLKERIAQGDKEAKEWRQRAKAFNFGAPGGMGANGLKRYAKSSYGVILSQEQAEHFYNEWKTQWPVIQEYLAWIRELTQAQGHTTIEHFVSKRWRGHVPYCTAANSFFQGLAADGAKAALYQVSRACYSDHNSPLWGCRPVNFIHDEILMEAPEERASEAGFELSRIMVEVFNRYVPDVPVTAEPALMRRWSKEAQSIIENGVLKVWEPES